MQRVVSILFGAGFTVTTAWAAGSLLLRRLRLELDPLETVLFSFLSGAACLSLGVFVLCLLHQARAAVFLAAGAVLVGCAVHWPAGVGKRLPAVSRGWIALLLLNVAPFLFIYAVTALAPEVSPDGSGYHLGNVVRLFEAHGFVWNFHSIYSAFPQGLEMLFLVAFAFGEHSAAALVHLSFLICLPLLIISYGRRFDLVPASVFAAVLVFVAPVFGLTGSSAYNDVALVTLGFAVFYLIQVRLQLSCHNALLLCGLLAGYSFTVKYTGAVACVFAAVWLLLRVPRAEWARFCVPAAGMALPWLLRNWLWIGNPFAPLLNQWFPNPLFSASAEKAYLNDIGHFEGLHHWWEFPLDVTIYGAHIPGFLGPVFLLAPLAVLAVRDRHGRRLLLAAAVFATPIFWNAATRFLMPGMPFLALALGIALQNSTGVIPLLCIAQAVFCWPTVTPLYAADWSWRIREIPVRAALRLEPEADFLRRRLPDYNLKPAIDAAVPRDARIFSVSTRAEAYLDRTIVVGYESTEGNQLQNLLSRNPLAPGALDDLKRRKIGFLLLEEGNQISKHLEQNAKNYGLTALAESNGIIFYRID